MRITSENLDLFCEFESVGVHFEPCAVICAGSNEQRSVAARKPN